MDQNAQPAQPRTFLAPEAIKRLREERLLTQRQLACALGVTDKAVSKWESGRGLPDITLVEPLARELGVSVAELLAGDVRANANRAGNMPHLPLLQQARALQAAHPAPCLDRAVGEQAAPAACGFRGSGWACGPPIPRFVQ